jgi:hypothetical protein
MTSIRLLRVVFASVLALAMLGTPAGPLGPARTPLGQVGVPAVRAATPDLTIVSQARYDVRPTQRRVHVTVDLTLTNRLRDTVTKRYYFDHAFLAVLPGSTRFGLTWGGAGQPSVRVASRTKNYTLLRLDLAQRLGSGKSAAYRLTFDLADPGGAPTRDLRVGDSLVSFPVWAFASDDTPGSSVVVVFPAGYQIQVEAGSIRSPTTTQSGRVVFRSGVLAKPLDFFAYLVADRPGAYKITTVSTTVLDTPVNVVVRSWADDAPWARRVSTLVKRGLPALGKRIGLPWPDFDSTLTIEEAVSRSTGGYAGIFDPSAGKVAIAYYADAFVVLHEASHAWFNGALLADRWSNEAFASYYGSAAASDLKIKVRTDVLTAALKKSKIPLNAWGPVGTEKVEQEDYAYAAALELARQIARRAGPSGLQAVWKDAAGRIGAYQPVGGGDESVDNPPDWRGLLDLLEERTDATYDDLWRELVARPEDIVLLDQRVTARSRYEALLREVDDWRVPKPIRVALRAWRFDDATALIDGAEEILTLRGEVDRAADAADLIAPAALRVAFEDDDGFEDATAEASAELQTIERYVEAVGRRPAQLTPIMTLGMWGETPEADLVAARDAFARGDMAASTLASDEAAASWANAESIGQGRAFSIGTLVLFSLMAFGLSVATFRRRRRRRRARMAHPLSTR